ncbi:hypothetical protein HMPREF9371_1627 [Neisseria shayeganii 871]|uniref:Uncharacterized protein n=1 Tax=Neisseria shayeganii 871 TaxID=1032488 RepID=G4CJ38_9NEIS|nr:hypothetical protein HMPREF9371_1627 [Neisseria shayeganii 871]
MAQSYGTPQLQGRRTIQSEVRQLAVSGFLKRTAPLPAVLKQL